MSEKMSKKTFHDEEVLGKAYDSEIMKRLLAFLAPYKLVVIVSVTMLIANSFFQIYLSILTKDGIDDYMLTGEESGLETVAFKYLGIMFLVFVTSFVQVYGTAWLGQKVQHDIRMKLFGHLQHLNLGFFDKNPVGRLVTRATNDVNTLNELFSSGVVAVIGDILMITFIVAALFYLNATLALYTFITLPILIYVTFIFRSKARDKVENIEIKKIAGKFGSNFFNINVLYRCCNIIKSFACLATYRADLSSRSILPIPFLLFSLDT